MIVLWMEAFSPANRPSEAAASVAAIEVGVATTKLPRTMGVSLFENSKYGADGVDDVLAGFREGFARRHDFKGQSGVDFATNVNHEVEGVGALGVDDDPVVEHDATTGFGRCRRRNVDGDAGSVEKWNSVVDVRVGLSACRRSVNVPVIIPGKVTSCEFVTAQKHELFRSHRSDVA